MAKAYGKNLGQIKQHRKQIKKYKTACTAE